MRSLKSIVLLVLFLNLLAVVAWGRGSQPLTITGYTLTSQATVGNYLGGLYNIVVSGGTPDPNGNYNVAVSSGSLPPGLAFNGQAVFGTPTAPGTFQFTLTATDSLGNTATTPELTITVNATVFTIEQSLSGGQLGLAYGDLYAHGGIPPYHWNIAQGTLPASSGLTLAATTTGQIRAVTPDNAITGTPNSAGTYSFTVRVTHSSPTPLELSQTYTISVINPTFYTIPPPGGNPQLVTNPLAIAAGLAGSSELWFTYSSGVQGIATAGTFQSAIPIPPSTAVPNPIVGPMAVGPDGYLWVADASSNPYIYRVTTNGSTVTPIRLVTTTAPPVQVNPTAITAGKDGYVWLVGRTNSAGYIGRVSTDGKNNVDIYSLPSVTAPSAIVADPDGVHLWFLGTSSSTLAVGRFLTTNDTLDPPQGCTELCYIRDSKGNPVTPPSQGPGPFITLGGDGGIWFATDEAPSNEIGRMSADGKTLSFSPISGFAESLVWAPDNAIWTAAGGSGTGVINRVTQTVSSGQTVSSTATFNLEGPAGSASPSFTGITVGPDGALWLTDFDNRIVQIFPSLVLNCNFVGTFPVGVPITNASCTAVGGKAPYAYSFDKSNLPPGVTVDAKGVLSGTPTAAGSFTITTNDSSSPAQQASQVVSISSAPTVQLDCSNLPTTGVAGQPYSGFCSTGSGNPPYTYKISPGLPSGLTGVASVPTTILESYQYNVSGTFAPTVPSTVTFTITAFDSNTPPGQSAPQTVTIHVTPPPVSLSCGSAQAVVGRPFQDRCFGVFGSPPYSFVAATLPPGLIIDKSSGLISGTPTAAGSYPGTVTITDSAAQTVMQPVTFSVINAKLALICNVPANPTVATAISVPCSTSNGQAPYSYSLAAGTLPAGLTFNAATGLLSGTPTAVGPATFTLLVSDSESPAATAHQTVTLIVHPTTLTILTTAIPTPAPPLPYAVRPTVEGGTPPYKFSISAGTLPQGLQIEPSNGVIYNVAGGLSVAAGPYSFTVTVTDSSNATASQAYSGTAPLNQVGPTFSSYQVPGKIGSGANGITVGPDANLWFTTIDQAGGNLVGQITPAGKITTVTAANALTTNAQAAGGDIVAGPDGQIWIAQRDGDAVDEVSLDLASQAVYLPKTPSSAPAQITAAPDGTLWFTESASSQIAHVGADGKMMEFATPSASSSPLGIAVGPLNLIAFTESSANKIGVITQDGSAKSEFATPTANSSPTSIVMGPDNALWFTEPGVSKIGRMDFTGSIFELAVSSPPQGITLGPDGALYFTEPTANVIGRITVSGATSELQIPDANSGPTGIVAGPDGAIWFTENNISKIGRLSFIYAPIVSCTLPGTPLAAGAMFSGTCTATQGTPSYTFSLSTANGSTPPPGVTIDPKTGALSGTLTAAGTFAFAVVVADSSSPSLITQQTYTFTVTPQPLSLTSCNPTAAYLYTPYSYSCGTVGGTGPFAYKITTGALPPGLAFDTTTGNITGIPTTLGSYPLAVQVTDSSTPVMTATSQITMVVEYGVVTGAGGPLFTLSKPPNSVLPGSTTPGLTLSVNEILKQAVSGQAKLTFVVDNSITGTGLNTPSDYVDPALQFVDSNGNPLGTTYNFTFSAQAPSITLPGFFPGTVLGEVTLTIYADNLAQTATIIQLAGATPVIEPGSVQFTNVTANSFDVEFVAMTPTRQATAASITFNPVSGDQISGERTFTFDVTAISNAWFSSTEGLKYGGRYSLTFPFVFNGNVGAIGSATVTLSEGANTSEPVTGNR